MSGRHELMSFETDRIVHGIHHSRAQPQPPSPLPQTQPHYSTSHSSYTSYASSSTVQYRADRSPQHPMDYDFRQLAYIPVETARSNNKPSPNTIDFLQPSPMEYNTTPSSTVSPKRSEVKTKKKSAHNTSTDGSTPYDKKFHAPLVQNIILNVSHCKYHIFPYVASTLLGWKVSKNKDLFTESTFSSISHPPGSHAGNTGSNGPHRHNKKPHTWDVLWIDSGQGIEKLIRSMKAYQRINHFPGMVYIYRKDLLGKTMLLMKQLWKYEYQFTPQTWFLPQDYNEIVQYLRSNNNNNTNNNKSCPCVILKPSSGAQGRGISLAMTVEQLQDITQQSQTQSETYIVQSYVNHPLLLDGYKFDMRIYVLVISCDPIRILLYRNGLCRLCTVPYIAPSKFSQNTVHNVYMHLTNYSINKHNVDFVQNNHTTETDLADHEGNPDHSSKRSLQWLQTHLEAQGIYFEPIWRQIAHIIVKTILSIQPILLSSFRNCKLDGQNKNPFTCFELLGFDILLTNTYQPVLLEVNHMPSFSTDSALDADIKSALIKSALTFLNVTAHERQSFYNDQAIASQLRLYGDVFEHKKREQHHKELLGKTKRKYYRTSEDYWKNYLHHEKKLIGHDRTYQTMHSTTSNTEKKKSKVTVEERHEALQLKSFDMFDLVYPANVYPFQLTSAYHTVYEDILQRLTALQEADEYEDNINHSGKSNVAEGSYSLQRGIPRPSSANGALQQSDAVLDSASVGSGGGAGSSQKSSGNKGKSTPSKPAAAAAIAVVDPEVRSSVVEMQMMSDSILSSLESLEYVTHQLKTITTTQQAPQNVSVDFSKPPSILPIMSSPPPPSSKKGSSSSFRSPHRVLSMNTSTSTTPREGLYTSTLEEIESTLKKSRSDCDSDDRDFGDDHSDAHTEDFRTHFVDDEEQDDHGDGEEEEEEYADDNDDTLDAGMYSPVVGTESVGQVALPTYYANIGHMTFDDRRSEGSSVGSSISGGGEECYYDHDIELPPMPSPRRVLVRHEGIAAEEDPAVYGLSHLQVNRLQALQRIAHHNHSSHSNSNNHHRSYQDISQMQQHAPQPFAHHHHSSATNHRYPQQPYQHQHLYQADRYQSVPNHSVYLQPTPPQANRISPTENFHSQYESYRQQYLQSYRNAKTNQY